MIPKPGVSLVGNFPGTTGTETPAFHAGKSPAIPVIENTSSQIVLPIPQTGPEVLGAALSALGLPADALSEALLVFARFFSIAPKAGLLANARKEILASSSAAPQNGGEKAALEAKALAVLAAADKGVVLDRESLEAYALTPEKAAAEEADGLFRVFSGDLPDAEDLRRAFDESGSGPRQDNSRGDREKKQLYDFLNGIPGENGQRWVVFPFNYSSGGTELRILVRILTKEPLLLLEKNPGREAWVIVDISGPKHSWYFSLHKNGEKISADIGVVPALSDRDVAGLQKEMRGLGFVEVRIRNGSGLPLAEIVGGEVLPSVNKAV